MSEQGQHPNAHQHKNPHEIMEEVRRRRRKTRGVSSLGLGIAFFVGYLLVINSIPYIYGPLIIFVVAAISVIAPKWFLRCPNCEAYIGDRVGGFLWDVQATCKGCGVNLLDTDVHKKVHLHAASSADAYQHKNPDQIIEEARRIQWKVRGIELFFVVCVIGIVTMHISFFSMFSLLVFGIGMVFVLRRLLRCPNCGADVGERRSRYGLDVREVCQQCGARLVLDPEQIIEKAGPQQQWKAFGLILLYLLPIVFIVGGMGCLFFPSCPLWDILSPSK
jgi:ribosomal protein L37AE/L43A